jgi:hypothetical protein
MYAGTKLLGFRVGTIKKQYDKSAITDFEDNVPIALLGGRSMTAHETPGTPTTF